MKLDTTDILAILRRFGKATDEHVPRQVERLTLANPSPINLLASFRFLTRDYIVLLDDTAEDDTDYIAEQIAISLPGRTGNLVANPAEVIETYGMPHKGKDVYLFALGDDKQRLDVHLASEYPDSSRSTWQKHIKAGYVSVNSRVETSPKALIDSADTIQVSLPAGPDHSAEQLDIVYLDDDVVVIDKPAGMLTHRKNDVDTEFTVSDFFERYITDTASGGRPGVVHRLDRDTSGLVIGARHDAAYQHLKSQFADRLVDKLYVAITDGIPANDRAHIDLPIARNRTRPGSFTVNQQGKPAQTDYQVEAIAGSLARIRLQPTTGRTHQLRVHMTHIGTPIHGDRLYGKAADRLYLHAHKLGLDLPSGERREFVSPVPSVFDDLVPVGDND